MKLSKITALLFSALLIVPNAGCSKKSAPAADSGQTSASVSSGELDLSKLSTFDLSSEDLHGGVWDTVITKTAKGDNRSPQLSWKPVDGAGCYAIYMVDTTAGNWLHWKSLSEGETELPAGWAPTSEYVGPYPPGGTHDYEIFVLALKQKPERLKGSFDSSNSKLLEYAKEMDGENEDNIISYGHLTGTYTYGD